MTFCKGYEVYLGQTEILATLYLLTILSQELIFYQVQTPDGQEVGKISKQWSGIGREMVTDSDNFGVTFPQNLDVKVKALLLGAVFLIDFMFFETSGNQQNDGIGMGS